MAESVGQYRPHWEERFERLDAFLRDYQDQWTDRKEAPMTATRVDRGSTDPTTIYSEGGDLTYERTFDAPRELVWKAHTDPELLAKWWGPLGHQTTVEERSNPTRNRPVSGW